jgi:hypothetical protein
MLDKKYSTANDGTPIVEIPLRNGDIRRRILLSDEEKAEYAAIKGQIPKPVGVSDEKKPDKKVMPSDGLQKPL